MKIQSQVGILFILSAIIIAILIPTQLFEGQGVSNAQDETSPATIQFTGDVTALGLDVIVVNGLTVNVSELDTNISVALGTTVSISGNLLSDGTIIATTMTQVEININTDDDDVPEVTETPAPEVTEVPSPEATEEPSSDGGIIIVIEGPVQAININVITIYNIDIELDADDPILTVIQIGDVIRIEGNIGDLGDKIVIINVINIIFINIEIYVDNDSGQAWRDSGSCQNAPPPWAPAHGWRRKCEGGGKSNPGGSSGKGKGGSKSKS